MKQYRWSILTAIFMLSISLLCGCRREETFYPEEYETECESESEIAETESAVVSVPSEQDIIYVHVTGAVNCPGVVALTCGARVIEAVEAAGGLREDADRDYCNLAAIVRDGEQVRLLTREEAEEARARNEQEGQMHGSQTQQNAQGAGDTADASKTDTRVNINTATKEELMSIPGIGASRADDILTYRQKAGAFSKIEDIMQVPGIKGGVFEKLRDLIRV